MLSKIAFSLLLFYLRFTGAFNAISLTDTSANPIETMFGNGYICLHVTDPIFKSSPSFQALAVELAKRFNKTVLVPEIGSNKTDFPHTEAPDTEHFLVDSSTTVKPPISNLILDKLKRKVALTCEKEGFFSNPNNCTKFYRCVRQTVRGKPWKIVEFDCPEYTIFDPKMKVCAHPMDVEPWPDCVDGDSEAMGLRGQGKRTTTTVSPLDVGQEQITDEPPPGPPTGPDHPTDEGEIELAPGTEPPEHECTMSGLFPDENNCHEYTQCLRVPGGFRLIKRVCEGKLIFDPTVSECRRLQDINPKPPCVQRMKKVRTNVTVTETEEELKSTETKPVPEIPIIPIDPETGLPIFPDEPEEEETTTTEVPDFFDEFESAAKTQVKKRTDHIVKKNTTTVTVLTETDVPVTEPSESLRPPKKRITIPKKTGPKPIPSCEEAGTFAHPVECNLYQQCVKRGRAFKIYFFSCSPNGTVFDSAVGKCVPPDMMQSLSPVPQCAHWDDVYRPIFEDILNEEHDEPTTTTEPPKTTTPIPDDIHPDSSIEVKETDDGHGNKKKETIIIDRDESEVVVPGEETPSQTLHHGGNKTKDHDPTAPIDSPSPTSPDYVDETTTGAPTPLQKQPEPTPVDDPSKLPCEDEVEYVKKLTQERDAALLKVAELEKQKIKCETQVKKMQKELGLAKKDKQKYENYIANMDKTIDDYKEKVAWYDQHCPLPTEFVQDDDDVKVKSRKRRSLDTSVTPVISQPARHVPDRFLDNFDEIDNFETKRGKVRKFKELQPRPIHGTSERVDSDDVHFRQAPFPTYDASGEMIEIGEETLSHRDRSEGHHRHDHGRQKSSHWSPDPEESFALSQIPLLIFTVLAILLITISIFGCLVVRRLYRVTSFTLNDSSSPSPSSYRRRSRKFGSV